MRCEVPNLPAPRPCSELNGIGRGIAVASARNARIRNGTIRNFGGRGVDVSTGADDYHASHLRLHANGATGFWSGTNGILTHTVSTDNGAFGIQSYQGTMLILESKTRDNASSGVRALQGDAALPRRRSRGPRTGQLDDVAAEVADQAQLLLGAAG